jgi:HAD superfamily hydrolase (TIGR01549 family)
MEDAPAKPNPKPVLLAAEQLGLPPSACIMIGDTPDDIR